MNTKRSNSSRARRASSAPGREPSGYQAYSRNAANWDQRAASPYAQQGAPGQDTPTPRVSRGEYERVRSRRRRRSIGIAVAVALVLVLGGAGAAFAYYYSTLSGNLHEGVTDDLRNALVQPTVATEPFYVLLMGTDGSAERAASDQYAGDQFRADSMILTRIDPQNKKVTMVSIHRDTLIDMGEYGQNKLNAAHALGGPALTVETVSKLAGVPISHYAEINFDGFKDIVDALGGVEVNVPIEIDDSQAGGHLDAGKQTLNGDQALILCRSRHSYDDYGDGDTYRAANQRLVLAAIAKKVLAADVGTMASTVQALSSYVTTDMEITDIVGLAQNMQGLDPDEDIYSAMEPTTSEYINGVWYEITVLDEWKTMMDRVDQGLPPTEKDVVDESSGTVLATTGDKSGVSSPSSSSTDRNSALGGSGATKQHSGTVAVLNGNGIAGAGSEASERVEKLGFTVESGNADSFDYPETVVVYDDSSKASEAQDIATALGLGTAVLNDGSYTFDADFLVVLGTDWS